MLSYSIIQESNGFSGTSGTDGHKYVGIYRVENKITGGETLNNTLISDSEQIVANAFNVVPDFINEDFIKSRNTNFAKVINQYNVLTNTLSKIITSNSNSTIYPNPKIL